MSESNGHGQVLAYIHDGYTRRGYIAEQKYLHPAVRFEYRPILVQNRSVISRQIETANDPRKEETIAARAIASQIVDWDLKNHKGETVPITLDRVLNLEPNLFQRLYRIVMGIGVTDEDPLWTERDKIALAEHELERALGGRTIVEEEAEEVKNFATG